MKWIKRALVAGALVFSLGGSAQLVQRDYPAQPKTMMFVAVQAKGQVHWWVKLTAGPVACNAWRRHLILTHKGVEARCVTVHDIRGGV